MSIFLTISPRFPGSIHRYVSNFNLRSCPHSVHRLLYRSDASISLFLQVSKLFSTSCVYDHAVVFGSGVPGSSGTFLLQHTVAPFCSNTYCLPCCWNIGHCLVDTTCSITVLLQHKRTGVWLYIQFSHTVLPCY